MTTVSEEETLMVFAKKAAQDFKDHPDHASYGEIGEGNFLALRWGMGNDCVLVLKQDEYWQPVNFQGLVKA